LLGSALFQCSLPSRLPDPAQRHQAGVASWRARLHLPRSRPPYREFPFLPHSSASHPCSSLLYS
jgi:hypothetical protein